MSHRAGEAAAVRPRPVMVVGDVCVDVVARCGEPPSHGSDTDAEVRVTGGGAGGNIAAWLATLGVPVTLVARVGDDAAGRVQAAELEGYGVRCAFAVDPAAATGAIVVLVGPDGERTMLADRGANLRLSTVDIPGALPAHGHLHLSGYTLLRDGPRAAGLAALHRARAAGMTISVDPASAAPLAAVGAAAFLDWTGGADLLLPNLAEARLLSGCTDPHDAARWLARRYGAVAVTLGRDGALWAAGGTVTQVPAAGVHAAGSTVTNVPAAGVHAADSTVTHVPAIEVHAVDSTGAGDAFGAGLLAAWLAGADGPTALRRGVRVATTAVTHLGARPVGPGSPVRSGF